MNFKLLCGNSIMWTTHRRRTGVFGSGLLRLAQPHARPSTILVDEFDTGRF